MQKCNHADSNTKEHAQNPPKRLADVMQNNLQHGVCKKQKHLPRRDPRNHV